MNKLLYLMVSGAGDIESDGIYTLLNQDKEGFECVWYHDEPSRYIFSKEIEGVRYWVLHTDIVVVDKPLYSAVAVTDTPLNSLGMTAETGVAPGPSISEYSNENAAVTEAVENLAAGVLWHKLSLKDALVERGVEVPEDLKLYAYPDLVKNIQGGGNSGGETNFYKCASVGSAGGGGGNIIRVSGAGHTPANGDYVQTDPTATGWNRVWQLQNASFVIAANTDYAGGEYWYLAPELGGYADEYIYYGLGINPENPWEVDSWEANRGADEPIPTFEVVGGGSESSANTWSGYKAVLVEETVTTEGETVVVVSGATSMPAANGTYRQSNTETGQSAIYTSEDGQFKLFMEEVMYGHWCIMKGENNYDGVYYSQRSGTNPWDSNTTDWTYESSDIMNEYPTGKHESLTVTQETLAGATEIKKYYDFEKTLTEGLTYGDGFTPVVGKIYADGAMIEAKLVEGEKAIFYEPFDGSLKNDFSQRGSAPVFDTINGRKCMLVDTSHTFSCPADGLPTGNAPRTVAAWIYTNNDYGWSRFVEYGKNGSEYLYASGSAIALNYTSVNLGSGLGNYDIGRAVWAHVAIVYDGSILNLYINGTLQKSGAYAVNTDINGYPLTLGYSTFNSDNRTNGYISELKIYDYALTAEEVNALANA